jgi:hypothetical protein
MRNQTIVDLQLLEIIKLAYLLIFSDKFLKGLPRLL